MKSNKPRRNKQEDKKLLQKTIQKSFGLLSGKNLVKALLEERRKEKEKENTKLLSDKSRLPNKHFKKVLFNPGKVIMRGMRRNKTQKLKKPTLFKKKKAALIREYIQGYKRKPENLSNHSLILAGLSSFSKDKW